MLYAVRCTDKPGATELRERLRADHLQYLEGYADRLVLGGAMLSDDGEMPLGSLLIVNVADRAEAEAFSAGDPFTRGGVFESVTVTRLRKALFNPAAAEGA
ncbi:MAG: YciI family protein [Alphaproteobacteria bacterium]